jgi:hypothetical protein
VLAESKETMTPTPPTIAYFITPHGFGHACRSAAVMVALRELLPGIRFELFTTSPRWIFSDSLCDPFGYHSVVTDVGMFQLSPLQEDAAETCRRLNRWLPFEPSMVADLSQRLLNLNCDLVVCDVSALGIAVARKAGLPSVMVENFTWDWIYRAYTDSAPDFKRHADEIEAIIDQVSLHIQTQPVCRLKKGTLVVGPIARPPRSDRRQIRKRLGLTDHQPMVLVSMGGVPDQFEFLRHLPADLDARLVIPGNHMDAFSHPAVIPLNTHSAFYHPDLMAAADGLIGKVGYSSLAEAYFEGLPFGYISRADFPESAALEQFLLAHMPCHSISAHEYTSGQWIQILPELLSMPRNDVQNDNGSVQTAHAIANLLD